MITTILFVAITLIFGALLVQKKFRILVFENGELKRFNYLPIVLFVVCILAVMFQPYGLEKIEAGHAGIKVNLVGDNRGASRIDVVSGFVLFNSYFEEVHEVPLDQRHIDYPQSIIVAKGGFQCNIKPSFNYSVNRGNVPDMFTNLRSTYKTGGLPAIEQGWLQNAIIGAVNDAANTFVIDDIFNDRQKFENAILLEANKRVGKWFTISQLKTNIQPPESIANSINAKAKAVQDAITSQSQALAAKADAQRKIEIAKGDSAEVVIKASGEAEAIKRKQVSLTKEYLEYVKIQKWDGVNPTTVLGSTNSPLVNIK